ncbi:MAG: energy transducer TonB [Phycisphaerae bacterium]|nr:energy transducer TonB [Saprospiraceae bacterium]
MRTKFFFFILTALIFNALSAQTKAPPSDKVYTMYDVQKEPSFPGGSTKMYKFMSARLQYPELAKENRISGNIIVSFVVDVTGKLTDIRLVKDIGGGCGKEAVRLVKAMPLWIPGEANGHKVKVRYILPFKFKLE